jgi:hypothetical protein
MTYTVVWQLTAIQHFNELVAAAEDPRDMGESRGGNARLWFWDRLGIYYTVDVHTMTVRVLLVGPARRR